MAYWPRDRQGPRGPARRGREGPADPRRDGAGALRRPPRPL